MRRLSTSIAAGPESESRSTSRGAHRPENRSARRSPALLFLFATRRSPPSVVKFIADAPRGVSIRLYAIPPQRTCGARRKTKRLPAASPFRRLRPGPVPMRLDAISAHASPSACALADRHGSSHRVVAHRDTLDANDLDIGHADEARAPRANRASWKSYSLHRSLGVDSAAGKHQDDFLPWTSPSRPLVGIRKTSRPACTM